jgi:hypothetical protein
MNEMADSASRGAPASSVYALAGGLVAGLFAMVALLMLVVGSCLIITGGEDEEDWDPAPYQAEVEEGLGAAIAIVLDTSGSMEDQAPGDTRPKYEVALAAIGEMLDATDGFLARRPDFPVRIAIYRFSSDAWPVMSMRSYDREAIRQALGTLPGPGGGTAIGEGMLAARPELYRAGTFRKYILVITDGENTSGRDPERVARLIYRKSEGAVQIYFVAFDTDAGKFSFLKEVGGDVLQAANGDQLRLSLDELYQGRILAEELDVRETEPARDAGKEPR